MHPRKITNGVSLLEVMIAFLILLIAVLTMVGYTTMIYRAAAESKHQALASVAARALLERVRDYPPMFEDAATTGFTETKVEYILDEEAGTRSPVNFHLEARASHIAGDIYGLVVSATWEDDQRQREVVLESRTVRQRF